MFERFTERAREAVVVAQEEARALGHGYIGTEHILLGLLRESDGIGAQALEACGVTLSEARDVVARQTPAAERAAGGAIPFTPLAKKALELALREALALGHNYIGTEHVLLGLTKVSDSSAVRILLECGVEPEAIQPRVMSMLGPAALRVGRPNPPGPQLRTITSPLLPADVRAFLMEIEREIRDQLGREPDIADYWLALASVPGGLGARVLAELGIDAAAFARAIERARADGAPPLGGLTPDQAARHARLLFGLSSPD